MMCLKFPSGLFHSVCRDLRITGFPDAPLKRRVCIKIAMCENSSSSSFSPQEPSRLLSMELRNEMEKWSRDFGLLPKPLSLTDCQNSTEYSNVRVAYQGLPGAFSEVAALKAYHQSETVPCDQFETVFKAVELWIVDKAVLPIENTVCGSIHRNYDLLLRHKLHIVGEVRLEVKHCLMALPGVRKEDLKQVLSHPQAFFQCEVALEKLLITRVNADSTAAAAQIVSSKNLRDAAAIASHRAAQIYGLTILEKDIQDFPDNLTRFLILAREPIIPRCDRPFKTSIVFTLQEGPGVLFKVLAVFALRKINLSKIESRPQKNQPIRVVDDSIYGTTTYFDYLFHVEFEASLADSRAQNALSHLQEFVSFFRVLGSYPMDTSTL